MSLKAFIITVFPVNFKLLIAIILRRLFYIKKNDTGNLLVRGTAYMLTLRFTTVQCDGIYSYFFSIASASLSQPTFPIIAYSQLVGMTTKIDIKRDWSVVIEKLVSLSFFRFFLVYSLTHIHFTTLRESFSLLFSCCYSFIFYPTYATN